MKLFIHFYSYLRTMPLDNFSKSQQKNFSNCMECVGRGDGIQFENVASFEQWDDLDRHERIRLSQVTAMVRKDGDAIRSMHF